MFPSDFEQVNAGYLFSLTVIDSELVPVFKHDIQKSLEWKNIRIADSATRGVKRGAHRNLANFTEKHL